MRRLFAAAAIALAALAVLAPAAAANHSCSASLALSASNATSCELAFKVSAKVLGAAHRTSTFPSIVTVTYKGRSHRFRRGRCSISGDERFGHVDYTAAGRLGIRQGWRLPHDEGLFDDPTTLCD
jgi:hypothetical protein